jgi:hypothetical protein
MDTEHEAGDWLARLVRDQAADGTSIVEGPEPGILLIETFEGSTENMPIPLHLDEESFERHLDALGALDRGRTFPGVPERVAGYRHFQITLDAVLRFRVTAGSEIFIADGQTFARPERTVVKGKPVRGARWQSH